MNAWTETPTKWYPLPIAVGAMVLVYVQYRRKRRSKEVQVDENGMEVIKLKGPWQVRLHALFPVSRILTMDMCYRSTSLVLSPYETCLAYGAT